MYARIKKILSNPFYFAMVMLILSYMGTPAFIRDYMGPLRKIVLVWGCVLLIIQLIKNPPDLRNRYSIVLFLFCLANCFTIVMNFHYKFFSNCFTFAYVAVSVMLIFNMFHGSVKEEIDYKMEIFAKINILFTFIFAIFALIMFTFSVMGFYERDGSYLYYGMFENRLWGLYNPNTGGMTALVSIVFSMWLLVKNQKSKFLIVNIVLQYTYMILTQSRSAFLSLVVFLVVYVIFAVFGIENFSIKNKKKFLKNIGKTILLILILFLSVPALKNTLVFIPNTIMAISGGDDSEEREEAVKVQIERIENFNEDDINSVSNGRVSIWKAGIQVFSKSPFWGVGSNNIYERGREFLDETTAIAMKNGGTHNVYISVLVNTGIIGFGFFGLFLLLFCIKQLKCLFLYKNVSHILVIGLIFSILVGDMMESRIVYSTSFLCFVFWISCGYLIYDKGNVADEKI